MTVLFLLLFLFLEKQRDFFNANKLIPGKLSYERWTPKQNVSIVLHRKFKKPRFLFVKNFYWIVIKKEENRQVPHAFYAVYSNLSKSIVRKLPFV